MSPVERYSSAKCGHKGVGGLTKNDQYLIVRTDILPEAIRKTARVKEVLTKGEAQTVNEAVEKVGLSRSAFYKYRDGVFPLHEATKEKIITIAMLLEHRAGVLSSVLNAVAQIRGNILTINQGIPLEGVANAAISLETAEMEVGVDGLLAVLTRLDGVKKAELVGRSERG